VLLNDMDDGGVAGAHSGAAEALTMEAARNGDGRVGSVALGERTGRRVTRPC
jgi:hypothetical protein